MTLNILKLRQSFPILAQDINSRPLVYFDNAATTQKPRAVIEALTNYYEGYNANIHRGNHYLAEKATFAFEETRRVVQRFLNAEHTEEIIFTSGTTDSINLVAHSFGRKFLKEGDEILISTMEHHSNIVPWQMLCEEKGCSLRIIPISDAGELLLEEYENLLSEKTKLVAITHVSNALGTVNPIKYIIQKAHAVGAKVLIDGAQAVNHFDIDVQKLEADFYAFSAHKLYGPTGIGVLYGKKKLLEEMSPYRGGGEMIKLVSFEKTTYNELPYKFEAGTPDIANVIATKAALDFISVIGTEEIATHKNALLHYATERLEDINGVQIIGKAKEKVGVLSFTMKNIHHQDIGLILDQQGVAIRTGHHCTQPLMQRLGILGTSRASFAVYNTIEEVDRLAEGILKVKKMMS